jgi:hypothetical protein
MVMPLAACRSPWRRPGSASRETVSRDHAAKGGLFARIANEMLKPELGNRKNARVMRSGGNCLIVAESP